MRSFARRFRVVVYVLAAWGLLRRYPTTRVMRFLARRGPRTSALRPEQIAYTVDRICDTLHIDCLPRSVALTAMLERSGRAPVLILGCRKGEDAAWAAHAWVELEGRALDGGARNYMPLARLSSAGDWVPGPATSR